MPAQPMPTPMEQLTRAVTDLQAAQQRLDAVPPLDGPTVTAAFERLDSEGRDRLALDLTRIMGNILLSVDTAAFWSARTHEVLRKYAE